MKFIPPGLQFPLIISCLDPLKYIVNTLFDQEMGFFSISFTQTKFNFQFTLCIMNYNVTQNFLLYIIKCINISSKYKRHCIFHYHVKTIHARHAERTRKLVFPSWNILLLTRKFITSIAMCDKEYIFCVVIGKYWIS